MSRTTGEVAERGFTGWLEIHSDQLRQFRAICWTTGYGHDYEKACNNAWGNCSIFSEFNYLHSFNCAIKTVTRIFSLEFNAHCGNLDQSAFYQAPVVRHQGLSD